MAIELMDGCSGSPHISSDDWAIFNEAVFGVKNGIFEYGNNFRATKTSTNTFSVGSGAALVNGRRVYISGSEQVTVGSVQYGRNRNDFIGIEYTSRSSGSGNTESAALTIKQGSSTTGAAQDPYTPESFCPLYKIPIQGTYVGEAIPVYTQIKSAKQLKDLAAAGAVTGVRNEWTPIYNSDGYYIRAKRFDSLVTVQAEMRKQYVGSSGWQSLTTLPQWARPTQELYFSVTPMINGGDHAVIGCIETNGTVSARACGGSVTGVGFTITYIM